MPKIVTFQTYLFGLILTTLWQQKLAYAASSMTKRYLQKCFSTPTSFGSWGRCYKHLWSPSLGDSKILKS